LPADGSKHGGGEEGERRIADIVGIAVEQEGTSGELSGGHRSVNVVRILARRNRPMDYHDTARREGG